MLKKLILLLSALFLINCYSGYEPETIISEYRQALGHLTNNDVSCSAFHIGNGIMVTAKHCVGDQSSEDLVIEDWEGNTQHADILFMDPKFDVAVLGIEKPLSESFKLWSKYMGEPAPGHPIMTMGFPGYYGAEFTFEVGYINESRLINEKEFIMSKAVAFSGESGGPVVSLKNGRVIGLADMMAERIQIMDLDGMHQHHTISLILPWNTIRKSITQAKLDYIL